MQAADHAKLEMQHATERAVMAKQDLKRQQGGGSHLIPFLRYPHLIFRSLVPPLVLVPCNLTYSPSSSPGAFFPAGTSEKTAKTKVRTAHEMKMRSQYGAPPRVGA